MWIFAILYCVSIVSLVLMYFSACRIFGKDKQEIDNVAYKKEVKKFKFQLGIVAIATNILTIVFIITLWNSR